ncbi:MAG TPA: hypothetical protein VLW50_11190 [Streptosporangiaceae bacterium]|nr:hypothetical protein [Streptosporangiaceae bacterium]
MLDDDFLVLVNAWWQPPGFTIPATRAGLTWQTATPTIPPEPRGATVLRAGDQLTLGHVQSSFRGPLPDNDGPA